MLSLALPQKSICCFYPSPVGPKEAPDEIDIKWYQTQKHNLWARCDLSMSVFTNGSRGFIQWETPGKGEHGAQQQLAAAPSIGGWHQGHLSSCPSPDLQQLHRTVPSEEPVWQARFKRTHSLRTWESSGKQPDTQLLPSLIYSHPSSIITICFQNLPPSVSH